MVIWTEGKRGETILIVVPGARAVPSCEISMQNHVLIIRLLCIEQRILEVLVSIETCRLIPLRFDLLAVRFALGC